jgi:hypothetical protein
VYKVKDGKASGKKDLNFEILFYFKYFNFLQLIFISTLFVTVSSGDVRNAVSHGTGSQPLRSYVESIQASEGAGGSSNFRDSGKYPPVSEISEYKKNKILYTKQVFNDT